MNIQPIGINQNRQPNFGITVKWTICKHPPKSTPATKKRNSPSMKQHIRKFIENMTNEQKTELEAIMKALRDTPGELEFNKPSPDSELIQIFTRKGKPIECTFIYPDLLDNFDRVKLWGNKFINAMRALLPPKIPSKTNRPIKLEELLKEFGIKA